MKNEKILKAAIAAEKDAKASKNYREGDFFIGCTTDEILPNGKKSTLVCVDCSWLKRMDEKAILDGNELDPIEESVQTTDSIKMKRDLDELTFTKWVDMIDTDGDRHHCKVVSYVDLSSDVFHPVEDTGDWVIYVEV